MKTEQYVAPYVEELRVALNTVIATSKSLEDPQEGDDFYGWKN